MTPVRSILHAESELLPLVQDGLGAVKAAHRGYLEPAIRVDFADSLDLDEAMRPGREGENRWDYLLGHGPSGLVVALEPHSAKDDEVSTVIAKRKAAREQLAGHLRDGARIAGWWWVASSKVHFANTEITRRRLDQNGIAFVGTQVKAKHVAAVVGTGADEAGRGRPRGRRTRR